MLSKSHLSKLQPSSTLLINEQCKAIEKSGGEVFKFGFGQSPFPIPQNIVDELKAHAFEKDYLPVNGLLSLRNAIHKTLLQKKLNHFSVDNVFVTISFRWRHNFTRT